MKKPPCKGCEIREVGCHSKCNAYISWAKEHGEAREKNRTERVIEFSIKNIRRKRWKHDRN